MSTSLSQNEDLPVLPATVGLLSFISVFFTFCVGSYLLTKVVYTKTLLLVDLVNRQTEKQTDT